MRFMGSAMRLPHVQGGFRENVTVDASQAFPVKPNVPLDEAAIAEPLSVACTPRSGPGRCSARRCW